MPSGVILVAGGKVPLNPQHLEDEGIWIRHTQKHIAAPACHIHGALLRMQSYTLVYRSLPATIKQAFSAGFFLMHAVDLCSLHVPTGDYYTV